MALRSCEVVARLESYTKVKARSQIQIIYHLLQHARATLVLLVVEYHMRPRPRPTTPRFGLSSILYLDITTSEQRQIWAIVPLNDHLPFFKHLPHQL
jgi:hypothetical protein